MTYHSLGLDWFEPCNVNLDGTNYMGLQSEYAALEQIAAESVTAVLTGGGPIEICGEFLYSVPRSADIAAVFTAHEQSARLIAASVLATLVAEERAKSARQPFRTVAARLVAEIISALRHSGDPSGCMMEFEESFKSWAALTNLQVPTSVSKTGWCEKSLALPTKDGHVTSCKVAAVCRSGLSPDGKRMFYSSPPPSPGDPRVSVKAPGSEPAAPPTRAEVEAEIRRKMALPGGGGLAEQEGKAEFTELASYLKALGQARLHMVLSLGLPENASEKDIVQALSRLGISAGEALDWFTGCMLDENCFREQMNIAIGEAERRLRDNRAKIFAATLAVGTLAYLVLGGRR